LNILSIGFVCPINLDKNTYSFVFTSSGRVLLRI